MTAAHLHGPGTAGVPARLGGQDQVGELAVDRSEFVTLDPETSFSPDSTLAWLTLPDGHYVLVDGRDLRAALDLIER